MASLRIYSFLLIATGIQFLAETEACYFELDHTYRYDEEVRKYENDTAGDVFHNLAEVKGALVVYFDFRYQAENGTDLVPVFQSTDDSFAPDVMTWAKGTGRNLLRLPLDATVLSLNLIGLRSMHMHVVVTPEAVECVNSTLYPFDDYVHELMSFLLEEVTSDSNISLSREGDTDSTDLLCRPAYSFDYPPWGRRGIGFKCCHSDKHGRIKCDSSYSDGWQVIWWGPVALMCWMYLMILVHIVKTFKKVKDARKERAQEREKKKQDAIKKTTAASHSKARQNGASGDLAQPKASSSPLKQKDSAGGMNAANDDPDADGSTFMTTANLLKNQLELMLMEKATAALNFSDPNKMTSHEKISFLDVLGLSQKIQLLFKKYQKIISVGTVVIAYYVFMCYMAWEYSNLQFLFFYVADSLEMYINVMGHLGWLFAKPEYGIFKYAVFEAIITFTLPLMVLYVYLAITFYRPRGMVENASPPGQQRQERPTENGFNRETNAPGINPNKWTEVLRGHLDNGGLSFPYDKTCDGDGGHNPAESDKNTSDKDERRRQRREKKRPRKQQAPDHEDFKDENINQNNNTEAPNGGEEESNEFNLKCCDVDKITRFFSTKIGRILALIFASISILYVLLVLGPFATYLAFFVAFAAFVNVEIVTPWLLPISLCLGFISKVFDPAIEIYETARNTFFDVAKELNAKEILKEDEATGQLYIPRDVFSSFFTKQSRDLVFKTLGDIVKVVGMTALLVIVTLALQYPLQLQSDNTTSHLGMQLILIFPLLGKMAGGAGMDDGQKALMHAAIKLFLKQYLKDMRKDEGQNNQVNGNDEQQHDDEES